MDQSIFDFQQFTSPACWRSPEQLRGWIRNHSDLITESESLRADGVLFQSARLALHDSENALAIALSPFAGTASVGLMPLADAEPTLRAVQRISWLELPTDVRTNGVEWCEDLLFLGSNRGRILVAELNEQSVAGSSGLLRPRAKLRTYAAGEPPIGERIVSASSPAATSLVRSVQVNRKVNKHNVLAARDAEVFIWDLNADPTPVYAWRPHLTAEEGGSLVLFARWAPGSDRIVLSGNYEGDLMLVDTRGAGLANGLTFAMRKSYAVSCAEFNPLLPFSLAAASSDGTFAVFDVRRASDPIYVVPSLQGDVTALQWFKLHPDLLLTAGADSSVSMWSLRSFPTYAVGHAQYEAPLTDLITTTTYLEQRGIGLTIDGALTLTGLRTGAMRGLAPGLEAAESHQASLFFSTSSSASCSPLSPDQVGAIQQAVGSLYTRQRRECYRQLTDCASDQFARGDTTTAMWLVSLTDLDRPPELDYDHLLAHPPRSQANSVGAARREFDHTLLHAASRFLTTLPLERVRQLSQPDPADLRRLEALRLNIALRQAFNTNDAEAISLQIHKTLESFSTHPDGLELLDVEVVCGIVRFFLGKDPAAGERVVQGILALVNDATASSSTAVSTLIRAVLLTAQEPLLTGSTRRLREGFFSNPDAAREAVRTQLEILRLGESHPREVIAAVNAYQTRCIAQKLPGMFGWLGLRPITLFLQCLQADSNYVTFFWTGVQCIEAFPMARPIETMLVSMMNRIHLASNTMRMELEELSSPKSFPIPRLRKIEKSLRNVHGFLSVLMRVQMECENVAVESGIPKMPPMMDRILELLNTASEGLLEIWAGVIDMLLENGEPERIRKYFLTTIRGFSASVEDLISVSAKGENDERLNEILAVCDDFCNIVSSQTS
ncbi:unnamed protein product [Phytomonas sp. Hart1]|nr:unnamed protein product [Phytomonas sp. Hart1]|eukprot:CCW70379.1 unnamed protein product [Phytomonas sp. isolate Hart1]